MSHSTNGLDRAWWQLSWIRLHALFMTAVTLLVDRTLGDGFRSEMGSSWLSDFPIFARIILVIYVAFFAWAGPNDLIWWASVKHRYRVYFLRATTRIE